MNKLILSLFSGIDLLGKGFSNNGFCVVSAGDKFLGSDIRDFKPPQGFCDGVIGGSPCQDFSRLNRNPKKYSFEMLSEFIRVVRSANPVWFLHENVVGVPEFGVDGYVIQRFELDLSWFNPIASRRRIFTFGVKCDTPGYDFLNPIIKNNANVTYQAVTCKSELSLKEMAQIQGCDFLDDLIHFSVKGKKAVIGNAVPLAMSQYLAEIINNVIYKNVTNSGQKCGCGCGRITEGKAKYAHQNCRKKASRSNQKCDTPV